jgi:hypothetical protein
MMDVGDNITQFDDIAVMPMNGKSTLLNINLFLFTFGEHPVWHRKKQT